MVEEVGFRSSFLAMVDDPNNDTSKADDNSTNKGDNVGDSVEVVVLEGQFTFITSFDNVLSCFLGAPSFEALLHYAALQRLREDDMFNVPQAQRNTFMTRIFAPKPPTSASEVHSDTDIEKSPPRHTSRLSSIVSEEEKRMAQRAFRTAAWVSVFYLITTEYFGPGFDFWYLDLT